MNYIREILGFYDLQEINSLSTGQIALWYALMYINNKCSWTEWFIVPMSTLESKTGLSRKAIYNARNILKQKGYIDFVEVGNSKASKYKMVSLAKTTQDTTQDTTYLATHLTTQDTTHLTTPLNKLNQTKPNETKQKRVTNVTPEKDPFKEYAKEDTELLAALEDYAAMRKELKAPLTKRAKELAVGQLDKLTASRDERIQILQQSVMNGWKGLFALEGKRQGRKLMSVTSEGEISPELQELEAAIIYGRNVT